MAQPIPTPTRWSAPYWQAAREGRLMIQGCKSCNRLIMYPKPFCPTCLGEDLDWRPSEGKGEVYTVTVQRAGAPSGFEDQVPYVLAVVKLDEGVQLMTRLVGDDAESANCGDRVTVDFQQAPGADVVLPVFRLSKQDNGPQGGKP